jgi:subtilase family serine protease
MFGSRRVRLGGFAVAVLAAALLVGQGASASASDQPQQVGTVPAWTQGRSANGAVAASQTVTVAVTLKLRNAAALQQRADAISTPGSPEYHHYMTAAQYHDQFAATPQAASTVSSYLRSHGLSIEPMADNQLMVQASGSAAQVESAFGTTLQQYQVGSETRRAPSQPPTLPASVAQYVDGVSGLSTGNDTMTPDHVGAEGQAAAPAQPQTAGAALPPPALFRNAPPCSQFWAQQIATTVPKAYGAFQPYVPCGYTPAQYRGAYGTQSLVSQHVDGSGVTVAVVDAFGAPTILADANQYASTHGDAPFANHQFSQTVFSPRFEAECDAQGWYGEETLDVEAVHGMAPGANVLYVGARSCNDVDLVAALNNIIDHQRANIITNSWGSVGDADQLDQGTQKAYEHTFLQAVVQGITVQFSSGDDGDEVENAGVRTVDFPASDPWVTAVGGTTLAVGSTNNYLFETAWGTTTSTLDPSVPAWTPRPPGNFLYGGGGGTSQFFAQPSYQKGVVPVSISGYFGGNGRAVPDIAMDGDPNAGMLVGETQTFPDGSVHYSEYRIGGTSLSCPLFAGMVALADQAFGSPIGFANPSIYQLAGTSALRDIVPPQGQIAVVRNNFNNSTGPGKGITTVLRTADQTGTLQLRRGYDDVTGVGTPNGFDFVTGLG